MLTCRMNPLVLFEDQGWTRFEPLLAWRSLPELVLGRHSLLARCERQAGSKATGLLVRSWMREVAAERSSLAVNAALPPDALLVNARWLGSPVNPSSRAPLVGRGRDGVAWICCDAGLASRISAEVLLSPSALDAALKDVPVVEAEGDWLCGPWDLVARLGDALRSEWRAGDAGHAFPLPPFVHVANSDQIHVGPSCVFQGPCVVDASEGPIFIDEQVHVGAFAVIEGPCFIGPRSRINAHAWLHGANRIGPVCKIGGEIDGCVFQGHSNKQHAGFLGHSYVASWVNLGAGTSNSDLKNTYGSVRVRVGGEEVDTRCQFFGAIIADHAKTGINTAIPTGAALGFASMAAGGGLIPKSLPAFAWLTERGLAQGDPWRLVEVAEKVMARRRMSMTKAERALFLRPPV
ncbi:MAG: hypothetical protein IT449_13710 [Phycisphaerales bacterium]|nr:hypothetical protein [Phycisphaerales bacterium]